MKKRHALILDLLTSNDKMEVAKLSELLKVSQVTIRRDLDMLEKNGIIIREHGYATINSSDDLNNRLAYHYESKQKIAKLAAESIKNGETVMIESGSCCAILALELANSKKDITIITNSAFIADFIRKTKTVKTILLGGEYQNESQVMVGPITRECAKSFFVDKFFFGTDGFTKESGFTGNDYMRSEAVRDMSKQASNIIIITEADKFNQKGVVSLIDTKKVNHIYTDQSIPSDIENYLISNDVQVHKA